MARKGQSRIPDCHPDKPHHAGGVCVTCYKTKWHREMRKLARGDRPKQRPRTVWPQKIVRVPVPGWGCLVA